MQKKMPFMVLLTASGFFLFCWPFLTPTPVHSAQSPAPLTLEEAPLPKALTLCGEKMPLENRYVREMLDRELTIAVWDRAQVFMWLKRAGRYFPYIEKRLKEEGMPEDLKYLAVAESALLTQIRSPKGARGTWQFMTGTARRIGLRRDRRVDERRHFQRSTDGALKYLKHLREIFPSWALALAAYNCGDSHLKKQMKIQKVQDYYQLDLPRETERFIFRIATAKMIIENPEQYGYRISPDRIYRPVETDSVAVKLRSAVHLTNFAESLGTNYKTIKELNPHILGDYIPSGRVTLQVPAGDGPRVAGIINRLARSATGTVSGDIYIVRPGDTLTRISRKTGVSIMQLRRINNIKGSLIKVGQRLRLTP